MLLVRLRTSAIPKAHLCLLALVCVAGTDVTHFVVAGFKSSLHFLPR